MYIQTPPKKRITTLAEDTTLCHFSIYVDLTGETMKIEEIPDEIKHSNTLGEMFACNLMCTILEAFPESDFKDSTLEAFENRMMELTGVEV